jgi:hypothetical protein
MSLRGLHRNLAIAWLFAGLVGIGDAWLALLETSANRVAMSGGIAHRDFFCVTR